MDEHDLTLDIDERHKIFLQRRISYTSTPELSCGLKEDYGVDGRIYLDAELDTSREIQEMKRNEEVGHEVVSSSLQISELPS